MLRISKSYQRLQKQDVITPPKTPKSNRVLAMPDFLAEEVADYIRLFGIQDGERLFPVSKNYLYREMERGCRASGVQRIRVHDLRHSHVSLLIELGFSALAIADREGHEAIDITYRYAHLFPNAQANMASALSKEGEVRMSERSLDRNGRWRSVTVAFRMSPEEAALLDAQVGLSGLTKQQYIADRLLERDVVVVPSSRVHRALRDGMGAVYRELRRLRDGSEIGPELEAVVGILAKEYAGLGEDAAASDVEVEDAAINVMQRRG